MIKRILVLNLISILLLLSACSSQPTLGERMLGASKDGALLAKDWNEGKALADKGKERIKDGKDRVEDGEEMIENGKDKIADGQRLIEKGHDAIARGEREQRDGEEMVRRGMRQMEQAESSYSETYPDLYRQITIKK